MSDNDNKPDNLPATEILDADTDLLEKASDEAVRDGDIDESVELDHEHQKAEDQYKLEREKQKEIEQTHDES